MNATTTATETRIAAREDEALAFADPREAAAELAECFARALAAEAL